MSGNSDALGGRPVLLFDGECGLCQAMVRLVLRRDRAKRIAVAPLQGEAGQRLLRRARLPEDDFDSLVFFPDVAVNSYRLRTDGVVAVLMMLSRGWARAGQLLGYVPQAWRDGLYRIVARGRHRLLGEPATDGLNRPEWADRVLP